MIIISVIVAIATTAIVIATTIIIMITIKMTEEQLDEMAKQVSNLTKSQLGNLATCLPKPTLKTSTQAIQPEDIGQVVWETVSKPERLES